MMKVALLLVVIQQIILVVFDDSTTTTTTTNSVMAATSEFRRYERFGATGHNNIKNDNNNAIKKMRLVRRRNQKRWLKHDDENVIIRIILAVPRGGGSGSGSGSDNNPNNSIQQQYNSPFLSYDFVHVDPPVIFTEMESFIRNRCIPVIQNSKRRFIHRLKDQRQRISKLNQNQNQKQQQQQQQQQKEKDEVMKNANSKRKNKEIQEQQQQQQHANGEKNVSESATVIGSTKIISFLPFSPPTSSSSSSAAASALSSMFVPSRIIKLSILSIILAEVLDRVGILYEDIPSILKTQCIAFWYYDIIPIYYNIKNTIGTIYNKFIHSLLPVPAVDAIEIFMINLKNNILYDCDYILWYTGKFISSLKVAFAIGVSCGLIGTPLLLRWTNLYWKPAVALYGLAEINHYCKRNMDIHLFKVLGEAPSTLGSTVDGILDQCRRLIRRTFFGQKQSQSVGGGGADDYYLGYYSSSSGSLVSRGNNLLIEGRSRSRSRSRSSSSGDGDTTAMTTIGGGSSSSRSGGGTLLKKKKKKDNNKNKNTKKAARDDIAFQGLIDEFKGWMITHPQQQELYDDVYAYGDDDNNFGVVVNNRQRRAMIRKGFLVGCGIGLAILGSNVD
jgi:hypothetical protein